MSSTITILLSQLLIFEEIANNLDSETKAHIIQELQDYPGTMRLICHENNFLNQLRITKYYHILNNSIAQRVLDPREALIY